MMVAAITIFLTTGGPPLYTKYESPNCASNHEYMARMIVDGGQGKIDSVSIECKME